MVVFGVFFSRDMLEVSTMFRIAEASLPSGDPADNAQFKDPKLVVSTEGGGLDIRPGLANTIPDLPDRTKNSSHA